MLKNEAKISNKLFVNNLTKLIEKYNRIDEVIVEKLEVLVKKVDDNDIKETLIKDLDMTLVLVDELEEMFESKRQQVYYYAYVKN
jgi:hypothetical protein